MPYLNIFQSLLRNFKEKSTAGLYTILLNEREEQIRCLLNDENKHQVSRLSVVSHKQLYLTYN